MHSRSLWVALAASLLAACSADTGDGDDDAVSDEAELATTPLDAIDYGDTRSIFCIGEESEMTKVKIEVREDPARLRPSDVPVLLGDHSKFTDRTGWKPSIPFEQTLKDMLEFWRRAEPARVPV